MFPRHPPALPLTALVLAAAALAGCAYYNSYYLAKKNFDLAAQGKLYPDERAASSSFTQAFDKSIGFSKQVLERYPKDKWADDAYLLWARALLGKGDPFQAAELLEKFDARYPGSPIRAEANFYRAVAYRQGRKLDLAVSELDTFQLHYPKNSLAPYASLERARVQLGRRRFPEAEEAAQQAMSRAGKRKELADQALRVRAQARFERGAFDQARADFHELGARALTDDERLEFALRESECLAKAGNSAAEIELLQQQLRGEGLTAGPSAAPNVRRARVLVRLGTAYARAGELDRGLGALASVVADYPKQAVAAEAQFQLGYLYEVYAGDFTRARGEYAKVRDQQPTSEFVQQAQQRTARLDRVEKFGGAEGDSLSRQAERQYSVAENYLLELNQPERALEEYLHVAHDYPTTRPAARALNAASWVLRRRLDRPADADSLLWRVIHDYRGTEEALAARDYLEQAGQRVPDSLIVLPRPTAADTLAALRAVARAESLAALAAGQPSRLGLEAALHGRGTAADSMRALGPLPPGPDSTLGPANPPLPADTLRAPTGRDTLRAAPSDTSTAPDGAPAAARAPRDSIPSNERDP
jgi:TolA-binding protein